MKAPGIMCVSLWVGRGRVRSKRLIPSPPSKPSREPVVGHLGGGVPLILKCLSLCDPVGQSTWGSREGWEGGEGDAGPMACPLILIFLPPIFLPLPTEWGQKKG